MCPEQQSTDGQSWVCDAWVVAHAGPRDAIAKTYKGETTGLPDANIGAVALNVTAVGGIDDKGYGFVTVYPCYSISTPVPNSSNLNFSGGQTIPNAVIAPVSTNGYICFSVNGNTDLLVDAAGYFPANP